MSFGGSASIFRGHVPLGKLLNFSESSPFGYKKLKTIQFIVIRIEHVVGRVRESLRKPGNLGKATVDHGVISFLLLFLPHSCALPIWFSARLILTSFLLGLHGTHDHTWRSSPPFRKDLIVMPLYPHLYFWEKETDPAAMGSSFYPSLGNVCMLGISMSARTHLCG